MNSVCDDCIYEYETCNKLPDEIKNDPNIKDRPVYCKFQEKKKEIKEEE